MSRYGCYLKEEQKALVESTLQKRGKMFPIIDESYFNQNEHELSFMIMLALGYMDTVNDRKALSITFCFVESDDVFAFCIVSGKNRIAVFSTGYFAESKRYISKITTKQSMMKLFNLDPIYNLSAISYTRHSEFIDEVYYVIVLIVTLHELAHIIHGHILLLSKKTTHDGFTHKELSQALEMEADRCSITYITDLLRQQNAGNGGTDSYKIIIDYYPVLILAIFSMLHLKDFDKIGILQNHSDKTHPPSNIRVYSCMYHVQGLIRRHVKLDDVKIGLMFDTYFQPIMSMIWNDNFNTRDEKILKDLRIGADLEVDYAIRMKMIWDSVKSDAAQMSIGKLKNKVVH